MTAPDGILVTGATGLVGLEILRTLLRRGRIVYAFARGQSAGTRELEDHARHGRVRLLRGDLARRDLGLSRPVLRDLTEHVGAVVHAAAHYRLSAGREVVWSVNVDGLAHLLRHARHWPLAAFHHISSITVAGDADGVVPESALPRPSRFRNFYEESKWTAESMVLDWHAVPLRIYRPGIVVGHSVTGETMKFDGPYAAFGLMRNSLPFLIGGSGELPFPLVTVDLVADVVERGLATPPETPEIIHVVDLAPPTLLEFARAMTARLAGHEMVLPVPASLMLALARIPGFERITGLEPVACEYMCARCTFSTATFAKFCGAAGIEARRIKAAYDVLALYYATLHGRDLCLAA